MFDRYLKNKLHKMLTTESDSAITLVGKKLSDAHIVPDLEPSLPDEKKVEWVLNQMTLEEKIEMVSGTDKMAVKGNDRLGLPKVWCSDASAGVRCFGRATAFPAPIALAASWNRDMIHKVGEIIGEECRAKGVSILLGPGVNIYRVPTCGRNFEYFGEDPYLAGEIAVPFIRGVQSKGVVTTVKHFACNNSEFDRHRMNAVVDDRTLQEIYLPAFKAAIQKGGSKGIMSSYNPVNGTYASENADLLTRILREDWGFDGIVMSDWMSVYSTVESIKAGLDLEMPKSKYWNQKHLKKAIQKGQLTESDIDRPVRNLLRTFFAMGIYDRPLKDHQYQEYSKAHSQVSLDIARDSIVLLKNDHSLLPIDKNRITRIAVVGKMAADTTTCGGGSCNIRSYDNVSILDGIRREAGEETSVVYLSAENYQFDDLDIRTIRDAEIVIVCVGFTYLDESEGYDKTWELPQDQALLIRQITRLNPNVAVTLTTGTGVETKSWLKSVPALLHCFFLGEKGGAAIADVLFGKTSPSGKLPFTMAKNWLDFESVKYYVKNPERISALRILGPQGSRRFRKVWDLEYKEKLMVGYRHFDTNAIEPQFPFGFGLSYTSFELSEFKPALKTIRLSDIRKGKKVKIRVTITNTGKRDGAEVIQLYIKDIESSLNRPDKELKGFEKVFLKRGQSRCVNFSFGFDELSFYHDTQKSWVVEPGEFQVFLGTSSRNIKYKGTFQVV